MTAADLAMTPEGVQTHAPHTPSVAIVHLTQIVNGPVAAMAASSASAQAAFRELGTAAAS